MIGRTVAPGLFVGLLLATSPAFAARILLPKDTIIYVELGEEVTSSERKFPIGYRPRGYVWRDVQIGGVTVIEAGTPVGLRVSDIDPRGLGGRGAGIEIEAIYIVVPGDEEISLRGGYGQDAPDTGGINQAIGTVGSMVNPLLGLPAAFFPGRKAVLEEGMVFDVDVPVDSWIEVPDAAIPTLNLRPSTGMTITVINEEVSATSTHLPLAIRLCGNDWSDEIAITEVNEKSIRRIPVQRMSLASEDDCFTARVSVELEALTDHFERGINRFTVTLGDISEEVVLNVEM